MATIVGAITSSHTPTIGFSFDTHKQTDPNWAIESYPENLKVAIVATGGPSHQVHGERAGFNNTEWDMEFMDLLERQDRVGQEVADPPYKRVRPAALFHGRNSTYFACERGKKWDEPQKSTKEF